ncbi:MAG: glycerol-3-phosphate dehydrogenase [Leptolyngbya sp. SIO4C1]|nr:glycerol-3-phosphate dehydrogenase [Leptolyngbya sp. SIO4C1]
MRDFAAVEAATYDLIVIGGGINGVAVARDAAMRGLKTVLVEKSDFASGTTSWSSRLVHGGLRYLEYFEFNLVRESLREREILLRTAPHLVKPIQLTIPIYASGSRSYWEIQAGMLLYDVLSYDKSLPNHRMLPAAKLQQLFRAVNPQGCKGGAQYYDAQVEYAERLCLEIVLSAQAAGADMLNYVTVTRLQQQGSRIASLACEDVLTGETFTVKGHEQTVVINTAGPWVDEICQRAYANGSRSAIAKTRKIGGTKGSHIIVDSFPGAPGTALYVEALTDGRPFFILPWLGMYLIGTTDLRFEGDLDRVKANDEEVDYLITETNRVIPSAQLSRDAVKFTYSGVRPLPYAEGKKPSSITRSHVLYDHAKEGVNNLISLIGGKLTTHRQVGEEMVEAALRKQKRTVGQSPTRKAPLPGAIKPTDERVQAAIATYSSCVSREAMDHLFALYGARAPEVMALIEATPALGEPLVAGLPDVRAQAVYAVQSELAQTILDICRRRTALSMLGGYGLEAAKAVAETLQQHCGWSAAKCDRSLADYRTFMSENCIPDYQLDAVSARTEVPIA